MILKMTTWEVFLFIINLCVSEGENRSVQILKKQSTFCQNTVMTNRTDRYTWFVAQKICSQSHERLTLKTNESDKLYWTGRYKRLSRWIQIIGCYSQSKMDERINVTYDLPSASVGLCQYRCHSYSIFALQYTTCICLPNNFSAEWQVPNDCNFTCDNTETPTLRCGGNSSLSVYATDSSLNDSTYSVESSCVSLQCAPGDKKFSLRRDCTIDLRPLCFQSANETYIGWRSSLEYCKKTSSYLFGNLTLSNASAACKEIGGNFSDPRWVGVFRVKYDGEDDGKQIPKNEEKLFQWCETCKCSNHTCGLCRFCNCSQDLGKDQNLCMDDEQNIAYITTLSVPSKTTTAGTVVVSSSINHVSMEVIPTTESSTENKLIDFSDESSVASIYAPVILVILLIGVFSVVAIFYIRKRQEKGPLDSKSNPGYEYNSDLQSFPLKIDCKTLQSSNTIYHLADNSKLEQDNVYHEIEEEEYEHLRNECIRKESTDDTYHHASSLKPNNDCDYEISYRRLQNQVESTYNHTTINPNPRYNFNSD